MSEKDVCKGSTSYDKLNVETNLFLQAHRNDKVTTPEGKATTVEDMYGLKPQYGTKEFPNSLVGATLATKEHDKTIKPDEKTMLQAFRKFPNSELLGAYGGMEMLKRLSDSEKTDFSKALKEAGCPPVKIDKHGSLEFQRK